jgi:hypothetical protein
MGVDEQFDSEIQFVKTSKPIKFGFAPIFKL